MTTYNTGSPLGSADPRDLYDNAENFDNAVNDLNSETWIDRFGVERKTWSSIERGIEEQLIAGGRIFDSEEQGRAAVENGLYYFSASDSPNVSKTLWKRISATESEFIADDPAKSFIDYITTGPIKSGVSAEFSPYTSFSDDTAYDAVDINGVQINRGVLLNFIETVGSRTSPYLSFGDDDPLTTVDIFGNVILSEVADFSENPLWEKPLYVIFDQTAQSITVCWRHDENTLLNNVWMPNGANDLFNYRSVSKSYSNDPRDPWELLSSVTTDHIPPITHHAVDLPNSPNINTTGGNHTGANGERTAQMTALDFYINGNTPLVEDFEGFVNDVTAVWRNEIFAGNTVNEQRYTTVQDVSCRFTPRNVEVYCKVTALEPIRIVREGGTQLTGSPWRDSYHFYGGQQRGAVYDESQTQSGTRIDYPDVWACVLEDAELGYCASWIDRSYGVKNEHVDDPDSLATKNVTGYKFYNYTVRHEDSETRPTLDAGESYSWRGGYTYSPKNIVEDLQSAFVLQQGNKKSVAIGVNSDQLSGNLILPTDTPAMDFETLGGVSAIPTAISFNDYSAKSYREV